MKSRINFYFGLLMAAILCISCGNVDLSESLSSKTESIPEEVLALDSVDPLGDDEIRGRTSGFRGSSVTERAVAGDWTVFHYSGPLVPGDDNQLHDIYLRNLSSGETTRISQAPDGSDADSHSLLASISEDGGKVLFCSLARNLTDTPGNGQWHVFCYDRNLDQMTRVSVHTDGTQANGQCTNSMIAAGGNFAVFQSRANNLVTPATNGRYQIFLRDLEVGTTTLVSVDSAGNQANGHCVDPVVSSDGRFVAFASDATNLVPGDTNGRRDIFVHDTLSGDTVRASVHTNSTQGNNHCYLPSISNDGSRVAFSSYATNLVDGDSNGLRDVFLRDLTTGETLLMSVDGTGESANGHSYQASLSGDGQRLSFTSYATNLVTSSDTNGTPDIFTKLVNDPSTIQMVSMANDGSQADDMSDMAGTSWDGTWVTFRSRAGNLTWNETGTPDDVFACDLGTSKVCQLSRFQACDPYDIEFGFGDIFPIGHPYLRDASDPSPSKPRGVAVGDFNGDDNTDVLIAYAGEHALLLLLGNGSGDFTPGASLSTGNEPSKVLAADLNGDDKLDAACANSGNGEVQIFLGNGDGTFTSPRVVSTSGSSATDLEVADLNGDSAPDLIASAGTGDDQSLLVFTNDGGANFGPPVTISPQAGTDVEVADLTGDGVSDLATSDDSGQFIQVFPGVGNGTFGAAISTDIDPSSSGSRIASLDSGFLDSDRYRDLAITCQDKVSVLLNQGDGTFTLTTLQSDPDDNHPLGVVCRDVNCDGNYDILWANAHGQTTIVAQGDGSGTFDPLYRLGSAAYPVAVAAADFNGDDRLDLVTANELSGTVQVTLNEPERTGYEVVSSTEEGEAGNGGFNSSFLNSVSADGRYVVFRSQATNLGANNYYQVLLKDRKTGEITTISEDESGVLASNHCESPTLSTDGRYVTFYTSASLHSSDSGYYDVYLYDRLADELVPLSVDLGRDRDCNYPSLSAEGRFVAFSSLSTTLGTGTDGSEYNVFVLDRKTGDIQMAPGDGDASTQSHNYLPVISGNGETLAWERRVYNGYSSYSYYSRAWNRILGTEWLMATGSSYSDSYSSSSTRYTPTDLTYNGRLIALEYFYSYGSRYYYTNSGSGYVFNTVDTSLENRLGNSADVSLTEDGLYMLGREQYYYGQGELRLRNLQTDAYWQENDGYYAYEPSLSADARYANFWSTNNFVSGVSGPQIYARWLKDLLP